MTFWRISSRCKAAAAFGCAVLLGCSDAGLYAINGRGAGGPDKADFAGRACVPLASGDAFPVRVLYLVQVGSQGVPTAAVTDALNSIVARFPLPYIKFGLGTFHMVATGYSVGPGGSPESYGLATDFATAVIRYGQATTGDGPPSMVQALKMAQAVLSGDMLTGCRGTVARTRYLVVMLVHSADTTCGNPAFLAGLDTECSLLQQAGDFLGCTKCELDKRTRELKALVETRNAGEVVVVPIYVPADPANPDGNVTAATSAIARAGGTQPMVVPEQNLTGAINALNYASLQQSMVLKRLIGFNRSTISLGGEVFVDSDGDGLSDDYERTLGTDPARMDSEPDASGNVVGDGIMDGVEIRMGMDPLAINTITGCNRYGDIDLDRLNDCEERVLGTDSCVSDTDGDSIPDLVEVLSRTNPLDPEDLKDSDADGTSNADEVAAHTDASSDDNAFRATRAYGYEVSDSYPEDDGRPCYEFRVDNITLASTLERPNAPYPSIPAGMNDLYVYFEVGRQNQVHGAGIGSLSVTQVRFIPPSTRVPSGTIQLGRDDFVTGN